MLVSFGLQGHAGCYASEVMFTGMERSQGGVQDLDERLRVKRHQRRNPCMEFPCQGHSANDLLSKLSEPEREPTITHEDQVPKGPKPYNPPQLNRRRRAPRSLPRESAQTPPSCLAAQLQSKATLAGLRSSVQVEVENAAANARTPRIPRKTLSASHAGTQKCTTPSRSVGSSCVSKVL